ncbi:hypothetical protein TEA_007219 [Camellia sinensis var. sinensis]|uniref:K-box domain-containing protein n=1 Tax=Camellia sinensis var. sinensis TaxID=542762 RepID=A0A4S4DF17_CAMSN|nr:hypothetical protein TEA_007219 [Camellia sinensis var. sinensis]
MFSLSRFKYGKDEFKWVFSSIYSPVENSNKRVVEDIVMDLSIDRMLYRPCLFTGIKIDKEVSMEKILEKYERYSYAERRLASPDSELQGSWSMEYPKLTARIEVLQRNIRHYVGEDLDPLSVRELQNLEQQIDTALKKIRSRKNQLMHESISELQKKEKALHEQNYLLANKNDTQRARLLPNNLGSPALYYTLNGIGAKTMDQAQLKRAFADPHCAVVIGTYLQARGDDDDDAHARPSPNALMPPWMLRQMNH